MRIVIQRVLSAAVSVDGRITGAVGPGPGILIFLGVAKTDSEEDAKQLARKAVDLRIFSDPGGKMNASAKDVGAGFLVISQFTLYGDCKKGRRPSFDAAASPDKGRALYERFTDILRAEGVTVETGVFGAMMRVELVNDGPVTFILDSHNGFSEKL